MGERQVPRNADEITAAWLTAAMRSSGTLRVGDVRSLTVTSFGLGIGLMSQVVKIDAQYSSCAEPLLPTRMIAKLAAPAGINRSMASTYGLYEREVRFYRELAATAGISTPRVLVAEHDHVTGDMALVLEDVSSVNTIDDTVDLDDEEIRLVARELAAFHTTWWEGTQEHPSWIPELAGPVWSGHTAMFRTAWEAFRSTPDGLAHPGFVSFGETLVDTMPALQRRLCKRPSTLVHFDFRRSNLIIDRVRGDTTLTVLDWQPLTIARGPYDLGYFLSQSISSDRRRAVEADTLAAYHGELVRGGVRGYGIDEVWEDYRLAVAYTANYAVCTVLVDLASSDGRRYAAESVERAAAAVHDLDVLGALAAIGNA